MSPTKKTIILSLLLTLNSSVYADVFHLTDGSTIIGEKISKNSSTKVTIKNKLVGLIEVKADEIVSVTADSEVHKTAPSAPGSTAPATAHSAPLSTSDSSKSTAGGGKVADLAHSHLDKPEWAGQFSLDFDYASPVAPAAGVNREITHAASARIIRKTPDFSLGFYGAYDYSEDKGVGKQADDWLLGLESRKDIDKNRFLYGKSTYIVDEVLGKKPMIETLAGVGFDIIKDERTTLTLMPGIAYADINYTDPTSTSKSFSEFGYAGYVEFSHLLTKTTAFKTDFMFVQSVEDMENYYLKGSVGFETSIYKNVTFETSLNYYYNDTLGTPFEKFTETVTTGFNVKF